MIPASIESLLARGLILWPARRRDGHGLRSRPLSVAAAQRLMQSDPYIYRYAAHHVPSISDTDLRQRVAMYVEDRSKLEHWHDDALKHEKIDITWRDSQPVVGAARVSRWLTIINEFDADALLAFDLVRSRPGAPADPNTDLKNWRTIARSSDFELEKLFSRGISDLHIHVGGVRLQQSIWLRLMADTGATRRYPQLVTAYAQDDIRSWSGDPLSQTSFADDMRKARHLRNELLKNTGIIPDDPEHPQSTGARWWSWHYSALRTERALLIGAWTRHLHELNDEIGYDLDQYLGLKHRFSRMSKQPIFEAPTGLKYFSDRYFRRLERREGDERARQKDRTRIRHRDSHRFTMEATANACAFLVESTPLRKVELRIAPMARAPDYWRYFRLWDRFKTQQLDPWLRDNGREPVQVGFAVHFKRSAQAKKRGDAIRPASHQRLVDLDRETSELRIALNCKQRGPWLKDLRRIDVAGNERDAQSAVYGFHLRLLRGDPKAINHLERLLADSNEDDPIRPFIGRWERIARRRQLHLDLGEGRLGLTVHAGEDYADQLDGLYQIAGAIDCCSMDAGDAIGHGLALAPGAERQTSPNTSSIERGASLASLCWLHHTVKSKITDAERPTFHDLCNAISRLAREIHGHTESELPHEDVVAAWQLSFMAGELRRSSPHFKGAQRIVAAFLQPDAAQRAEKFIDAAYRQQFRALTEIARKHLCEQMIARGIVVEMNPSSNIRISGAEDPSLLPTVQILQMISQGLIACINTDNPGVFATCIENEYAMLLESAREARDKGAVALNEREIRDLIERARLAGMESVYWR